VDQLPLDLSRQHPWAIHWIFHFAASLEAILEWTQASKLARSNSFEQLTITSRVSLRVFGQESTVSAFTEARTARLKVKFGKWFSEFSGRYRLYNCLIYFVSHISFPFEITEWASFAAALL
jgi:hypothetical protein